MKITLPLEPDDASTFRQAIEATATFLFFISSASTASESEIDAAIRNGGLSSETLRELRDIRGHLETITSFADRIADALEPVIEAAKTTPRKVH